MVSNNIPTVQMGIIAVSRDCFPIAPSTQHRKNIVAAYGEGLYECPITVENELDMLKAVDDVKTAGYNALVVFLGNFGPETPETEIAQKFDGPCMFVAAAEGDGDMVNGWGDAYCGWIGPRPTRAASSTLPLRTSAGPPSPLSSGLNLAM